MGGGFSSRHISRRWRCYETCSRYRRLRIGGRRGRNCNRRSRGCLHLLRGLIQRRGNLLKHLKRRQRRHAGSVRGISAQGCEAHVVAHLVYPPGHISGGRALCPHCRELLRPVSPFPLCWVPCARRCWHIGVVSFESLLEDSPNEFAVYAVRRAKVAEVGYRCSVKLQCLVSRIESARKAGGDRNLSVRQYLLSELQKRYETIDIA